MAEPPPPGSDASRPPSYDAGRETYAGISTGPLGSIGDLEGARAFAEMVVDTVREGLLVLDFDLRVVAANESFYQTFGVEPEGTVGRLVYDLGNGQWDVPELRELLEDVLPRETAFEGYEVDHEFEGIGRRVMVLNARRLDNHRMVLLAIEDATERKRAEEAVRESEERYRLLFENMTEGFALCEMIWDDDGAPADWRYLEVNRAWEQTGVSVSETRGRTAREVNPDIEPGWIETYGRVVQTGEPVTYEAYAAGFGKWFATCAFKHSEGRFALLFLDVTERKQAEEARQAFLLRLSDALRAEPSEGAVVDHALRALSEQMGLDRCYVGVYRLAEGHVEFPYQVGTDDVPPLPAGVRLSDFPGALRVATDRTLVIDDVAGAEGLSDVDRQNLASLGLGALIAASVREGEANPIWAIVAVSAQPRDWRPGEVALVEEVAERTWAAVERVRAEAALRESEERQAFLLTLSDALAPLAAPPEIAAVATERLRERLGVSRAYYGEITGDVLTVVRDAAQGVPSLVGEHSLTPFGAEFRAAYRSAAVVVVGDVGRDPRLTEAARAALHRQQVAAFADAVSFEGDGVSVLAVQDAAPRAWSAAEVGVLREVAERVRLAVKRARAEGALRQSEERYRTLFESMTEGFCVLEVLYDDGRPTDYRFIETNPAFERHTGLVGAVGRTARELVPGLEDHWVEAYARVAETGESARFEQGSVAMGRLFEVEAFRVGSPGRRRVGLLFADVTERAAAEAGLRQSEERFRTLAETVPDAVFTATPDGTVDYVNRQHTLLTGVDPGEVLGTTMWPDLVHPGDRRAAEAAWYEAQAAQEPFEVRYRICSGGTRTSEGEQNGEGDSGADSTYRWVIVRARPVSDEGGALARWFGTITDVDALVRAEAEVRELNRTLEGRVEERTAKVRAQGQRIRRLARALTMAEQEERRRLAQVLHDDLQQTLHGAQIQAELGDTERVAAILEEASRTARSLSHELAPPILKGRGLSELFEWLAQRERSLYGLEVYHDGGGLDVPDEEVRVLLYRLLRELLFNVAKHAGVGRARVWAEPYDECVRVVVEDDGVGFDVSALEEAGRAGLGLTSVRERLEAVGGRLEVTSAPGEGTRVTVEVPVDAE